MTVLSPRSGSGRRPRRFLALLALGAVGGVGLPGAAAEWVDVRSVSAARVVELCGRASGLTHLARTQMSVSQDAQWQRLARQALAIDGISMGAPPLDPAACYVFASAGRCADPGGECRRRAFEVRDFSASPDETLAMVLGRQHSLAEPPVSGAEAIAPVR